MQTRVAINHHVLKSIIKFDHTTWETFEHSNGIKFDGLYNSLDNHLWSYIVTDIKKFQMMILKHGIKYISNTHR